MDSYRKAPNRYNKVNQQKKFHLLTLIFKRQIPVREAAQIIGINYLTAKTIVFFHKNNHKTYQFDLENIQEGRRRSSRTASVVTLKKLNAIQEKLNYPKSRIEVICSIGNILSPASTTSEREGPPQKEAATGSPLLEALPSVLDVPTAHRNALNWQFPSVFESGLPRRQIFEGQFGFGDGETDRTRVPY